MSGTEDRLKQEELELDAVGNSISELRGALMFASGESRAVLSAALQNATGRLRFVENKVKDLRAERVNEIKQTETLAALVAERELRLDASERETFAGFLRKDRFTKADFAGLESFYEKTYDRLSDNGKAEMSHRVWEGIRRDEYEFSDLPEVVQKKEAKRAYSVVKKLDGRDVAQIPLRDREDLIGAYEAGRTAESAAILNRESFKTQLFRSCESKSVRSQSIGSDITAASLRINAELAGPAANSALGQPTAPGGFFKEALGDIDLRGISMDETLPKPSASQIVQPEKAAKGQASPARP